MDNPGFVKKIKIHPPIQRSMSMHPELLSRSSNDSLLTNFKRKIFNNSSFRWIKEKEANSKIDLKTINGPNCMLSSNDIEPDSQTIDEGVSVEISVQVYSDTIRRSLLEQARQAQIKMSLFDDIASIEFDADATTVNFGSSSYEENNLCFLWAAFHKKWFLFEKFLELGADLNFQDVEGISAIHISSFVGCLEGTTFLISNGINFEMIGKGYTPLHYAVFGKQIEIVKLLLDTGANVNPSGCEETPLHCAVKANSLECLKLLLTKKVDVNSIEPCGLNIVHLAAELGKTICLELLLEVENVNINAKTSLKFKKMTALHLAAEESNTECVILLLKKGANVNSTNYKGSTPLHLAAKSCSLECVEALLKIGKANVNAEDCDKRTPLHSSISKLDASFDIAEFLIKQGATVNLKDQFGFTPLHLAAVDGISNCVELFIYHGADLTTKVKNGNSVLNVILRKTPSSIDMVTQKLNAAITLHNVKDSVNKGDVELKMDFRQISLGNHPFEMKYLNTFVEDGKKEILLHPLCSAFLYLKWEKIRIYFIARFLFYLIFVSLLTLFIFSALINFPITNKEEGLHSDPSIIRKLLKTNDPQLIYIEWWVLFFLTLFEIFYKIYGLFGYNSILEYTLRSENIIEISVIVGVFLVSHLYYNPSETKPWQIHVGALAILAGWTNLMLMIGQLPILGSYVAMYQKVQKEFAKLFLAYFCIIAGFSFSFIIIFAKQNTFSELFMSFITIFTLMVGELDMKYLTIDEEESLTGTTSPTIEDSSASFFLEFSSQFIFLAFIFFVTVVLMNLLVGIAVHDIQGLRNTAELSKLVRQTKLMTKIESALVKTVLPQRLSRILYASVLLSPGAYMVSISVKPFNPTENRLPQDIMMAAYDIAQNSNNKPCATNNKLFTKSKISQYMKGMENISSENMHEYHHQIVQEPIKPHNVLDEITKLKHLVKSQHDLLQSTMSRLDMFCDKNASNC